MTILALEFSSEARSVALLHGSRKGESGESGGRSTHAFQLIQRALAEAGVEREAVEVIALGLGPGSYTGIRVAIAIAQGWQLALGVKLLGVSTADVLAEQAREEGRRGRFHVAIDAQRGEFYHAAYDLDEVAARAVGPLRLATLETLKQEAGAEPVLGGADIVARLPGGRVMLPNAATLGRLAVGRTDYLTVASCSRFIYEQRVLSKRRPPARLPWNRHEEDVPLLG